MKRVAAWLLAGLLLGLAGAGGALLWVRHQLEPVRAEAPVEDFTIRPGASTQSVAAELERRGLVRDARAFEWLARWQGVAGRLHVGEFEVSAAWPAREILARFAEGRVKTYEVVIPEGWTAREVAARLDEAGIAPREGVLAVVTDPESAARLGVQGPGLEGYLFPETYRFPRGMEPRAVVGVMVRHFLDVWEELAPEAARQGMSMREVVTLASIVEKETGAAEERPVIAAVFHNRLERGMRLESDPTTIYGIADFDGNLKRRDLEDGTNPYNTYKIRGLPPGPIANPGAASLRAVLEPAPAPYLYFVSRNDGTHVFSRTFEEHERNVDRYQRRGGR